MCGVGEEVLTAVFLKKNQGKHPLPYFALKLRIRVRVFTAYFTVHVLRGMLLDSLFELRCMNSEYHLWGCTCALS